MMCPGLVLDLTRRSHQAATKRSHSFPHSRFSGHSWGWLRGTGHCRTWDLCPPRAAEGYTPNRAPPGPLLPQHWPPRALDSGQMLVPKSTSLPPPVVACQLGTTCLLFCGVPAVSLQARSGWRRSRPWGSPGTAPGKEWVLCKQLGGERTSGGVSARCMQPILVEAPGPLLSTGREERKAEGTPGCQMSAAWGGQCQRGGHRPPGLLVLPRVGAQKPLTVAL